MRAEFLNIIINECDRIKRLIDQVLEVEKLENAKPYQDGNSDIIATIKKAIQRLQPQMTDKGVELKFTTGVTKAVIGLNEDKMLQVILNLLSNALKFCDYDKGEILIDVSKDLERQAICFTIFNNGKHIPTEYQNKIFEKFVQVKDGNLAKPEGSGLGLYITKKFVENIGGTVSFTSSESVGTTFKLYFPYIEANYLT